LLFVLFEVPIFSLAAIHLIGLLTRFGQRFQEILTVHIVEKDVFSPIPSAHHVIDGTRILNPHLPWHDQTIQRNPDHSQHPNGYPLTRSTQTMG
jgi:hypothetical protein